MNEIKQEFPKDNSPDLPKYQCHKIVRVLKLKEVHGVPTEGGILVPENPAYEPFQVDKHYWSKHNPEAGGYYVQYEDGYASWSPAEAFEEGYTLMEE